MPTGLCNRWEYNSGTGMFRINHNKFCSFDNMARSSFQGTRPHCKLGTMLQLDNTTKVIASAYTEITIIVTHFLKLGDIIITTLVLKEHDILWVMPLMRTEYKIRSKTTCASNKFTERKFKLSKCGNAGGGIFMKPMHQSRGILEKSFHTNLFRVKSDSSKKLYIGISPDTSSVILKFL